MGLNNREIGNIGEEFAADFLYHQAYDILERNWRFKKAEIDIIAKKGDCLIFIEVKTKSYTYFGEPEEQVSDLKESLIFDAAQRYMEYIGHDWEIRFDIIAIILDGDKKVKKISHFKDAF